MHIEVISTDPKEAEELLTECEELHRVLRPEIGEAYVPQIISMMDEGARIIVGREEGAICSLALYRIFETTLGGRRLHIEDLVTAEPYRGRSFGRALLEWLETQAKSEGCIMVTLDSGVQRGDAHRFYFRAGYTVTAFCFEKGL